MVDAETDDWKLERLNKDRTVGIGAQVHFLIQAEH